MTYFQSVLTYIRSVLTYIRSVLTYIWSVLTYIRPVLTYIRSVLTYIRSLLTYIRSVLTYTRSVLTCSNLPKFCRMKEKHDNQRRRLTMIQVQAQDKNAADRPRKQIRNNNGHCRSGSSLFKTLIVTIATPKRVSQFGKRAVITCDSVMRKDENDYVRGSPTIRSTALRCTVCSGTCEWSACHAWSWCHWRRTVAPYESLSSSVGSRWSRSRIHRSADASLGLWSCMTSSRRRKPPCIHAPGTPSLS